MITIRLPKDLDGLLTKIANETHRTKSYYVTTSLREYLEDREDYLLAIARLEEKNPSISLEEVMKKLGLED